MPIYNILINPNILEVIKVIYKLIVSMKKHVTDYSAIWNILHND